MYTGSINKIYLLRAKIDYLYLQAKEDALWMLCLFWTAMYTFTTYYNLFDTEQNETYLIIYFPQLFSLRAYVNLLTRDINIVQSIALLNTSL